MRAPILIVALASSVHTWRWMRMVGGAGRPVVLLPATLEPPLPALAALPAVAAAADLAGPGADGMGLWAGPLGPPDDMPAPIAFGDRSRITGGAAIAAAVRALRPALLHSMEIQAAGYACLQASRLLGAACPPWLVSNWGSDIVLYRKLPEHRAVLEAVARRMDGCLNECARDAALVRALGFEGAAMRAIPASGGADFSRMPALSALAPPSARRTIVVKGYHGWSGRGQHVLSALHLAAPHLHDMRIAIVLGGPDMAAAARLLAEADGLDVTVTAWEADHVAALDRLAQARLMIGVGISDGIGTTLLEAMALGAFPIVACTSCADEWLRPGIDGFIVDPHDTAALAEAIVAAVTDDRLVDAAAPRNRATVERRWNVAVNRNAALATYAAMTDRAA